MNNQYLKDLIDSLIDFEVHKSSRDKIILLIDQYKSITVEKEKGLEMLRDYYMKMHELPRREKEAEYTKFVNEKKEIKDHNENAKKTYYELIKTTNPEERTIFTIYSKPHDL